ncbi:TPA: hypothetical protein ACQ71X_000551 [Escherichia coli]|uniref:hypothetical protein n=1 Tax=Escherichia TaxID=561 RepID=UPI0017BE49EA|nr:MULTISPECIES: hypothetical protein [Escherichia]EEY2495086.1 hypothetical protein [Escherichia coli]EFD1402024.1 hypothetical protein [Escherichia coli]EFN6254267.1 hypothetical protein [Escherichia coli]EGI4506871.1 hypothetical protein [Escherichia coli]EIF9757391.1 hypothetical protein [Escherichia coli]
MKLISSPFLLEIIIMYQFIYNSDQQIMGLMLTADDVQMAEAEGFLILKAGHCSWDELPQLLVQTDEEEQQQGDSE